MGSLTITRSPAMVRYVVTQDVTITVSVYDDAGALADPSNSVTVTTTHPEGVDTDETMTHASTGVYTTVVTLDASGRWLFHAQSAGDIVAAEKLSITVAGTDTSGVTADSTVLVGDLAAEEGTHPYKGSVSWEQRRGWIEPDVDETGTSDITAELRACYGRARYGQHVHLRHGRYKVGASGVAGPASIFTMPNGVTLGGEEKGFEPGSHTLNDGVTTTGAQLEIYSTGKLFTLGRSSLVTDLALYYPDQKTNAAPDAYDWAFYVPANTPTPTVKRIAATNPYKLLYCDSPTRVDEVYGFPLSQGIHLGRIADVMRVSNVHFNTNNYQHGATLVAWVQANGRAFVVEQAEQFHFLACFAILYLIGLDFKVEATPDGSGSYGEWIGGGLDACQYCVVVNTTTSLSGAGFKMHDCSLVSSLAGGVGILCQDTTNTSSAPVIDFSGSLHGAHDTDVWCKTGSHALVRVHDSTLEGGALRSYLNQSPTARIEYDRVRTPFATPRGGVTENPATDRNGITYGGSLGTDELGGALKAAQTTSIGTTALFPSAPPVGEYDVAIYAECTTASGSGSPTLTVTIGWTDDVGATTYTTTTLSLAATGRLRDRINIRVTGLVGVTFRTTVASASGSPQYTVSVRARQL